MQRRTVLASVATLTTTGLLAGCATNSPGRGPTNGGTPTDTPSVAGTDFTVTNAQPGNEVNEASVSFEDDAVVVTGTIAGADSCKTAHLKEAELSDGSLAVTVATKDRPDAGDVCSQVITEISYEATVTIEGPLPAGVTVVHESMGETREVASAERAHEGGGTEPAVSADGPSI